MRIQAMSQITGATAVMAFCLPRLRAIRRYIAPSLVSVLAADITAWPSAPRRYGLPLPAPQLQDLSPDCMVREVSLAQAAAWPGAGNVEGSVASSAMSTRALTAPMPADR